MEHHVSRIGDAGDNRFKQEQGRNSESLFKTEQLDGAAVGYLDDTGSPVDDWNDIAPASWSGDASRTHTRRLSDHTKPADEPHDDREPIDYEAAIPANKQHGSAEDNKLAMSYMHYLNIDLLAAGNLPRHPDQVCYMRNMWGSVFRCTSSKQQPRLSHSCNTTSGHSPVTDTMSCDELGEIPPSMGAPACQYRTPNRQMISPRSIHKARNKSAVPQGTSAASAGRLTPPPYHTASAGRLSPLSNCQESPKTEQSDIPEWVLNMQKSSRLDKSIKSAETTASGEKQGSNLQTTLNPGLPEEQLTSPGDDNQRLCITHNERKLLLVNLNREEYNINRSTDDASESDVEYSITNGSIQDEAEEGTVAQDSEQDTSIPSTRKDVIGVKEAIDISNLSKTPRQKKLSVKKKVIHFFSRFRRASKQKAKANDIPADVDVSVSDIATLDEVPTAQEILSDSAKKYIVHQEDSDDELSDDDLSVSISDDSISVSISDDSFSDGASDDVTTDTDDTESETTDASCSEQFQDSSTGEDESAVTPVEALATPREDVCRPILSDGMDPVKTWLDSCDHTVSMEKACLVKRRRSRWRFLLCGGKVMYD